MGWMLSFCREEDDRYNSFKAPLLICKTPHSNYYFMRSNHLGQNYPTGTAAKECSNCSRRVKSPGAHRCYASPGKSPPLHCSREVYMLPVWKSLRLNTAEGNWGMNLSPVPQWQFHSSPFLMPSHSQCPFLFYLPLRGGIPETRDTRYTDKLQNKLCLTTKKHTAGMRFEAIVHEVGRSRLLAWFKLTNSSASWAKPKSQWRNTA